MAGSSGSRSKGSASRPAPSTDLPGSSASEKLRRQRLSNQVLLTGVTLGLLLIGTSLWLGTSQGLSQASAGLTALGVGDPLVGLLVLLVIAVALFSLALGLKDRVIAKIGLRNVTRARTRTLVLLFGLLIGSAIISSSLVIGDTVDNLSVHFTYIADGAVDEAVYAPAPQGGIGGTSVSYSTFDMAIFSSMNTSAARIPNVQGLTPMLITTGSAYDRTQNVAQPGLTLIGVDAWASSNLGSFTSTTGASVSGPSPGKVLLNAAAATELSAHVGDKVSLSGAAQVPVNFTVLSLVKSDTRGGFQDSGMGDVFLSLSDAQALCGGVCSAHATQPINYIAVTNTGGLVGGTAHTNQVWGPLNSSKNASVLANQRAGGTPPGGLEVHSVLLSDLLTAEANAQSLTQLFLVLGLFSIGAGCVLIVGIFAMLAEERRGEMGVARAVGMRRGQLIRAYYFEGLAYSAGSALLGTFLGVLVGWGIIQLFASLFGSGGGVAASAIVDSFTFTPRSLALAYSAGFLLTLVTVSVTSAYVSRMNIVRAIRSQPELIHKERSRRALLGSGVLLLLLGAALYEVGHKSGTDIDVGFLGASLLILAVGLIAAYRVPLRWTFSASALGLLVFWGDLQLRNDLFPGTHSGTIFVFFQMGVFLILAAVILYVFNSDLIVQALTRLSRSGSRNLPVVRLAFSYPSQRRFRSAMTISIFAMVLFTITAIAAIGNGISSGVSNSIHTESGGYQFYGVSPTPITDLASQVQNNSTLRGEVSTLVSFYSGMGLINPLPSQSCSSSQACFGYGLAAAPTPQDGTPAWQDFYSTNQFSFSATLPGWSPSQIWQALETNSSVAVVDGSFQTNALAAAIQGGSGHAGVRPGDRITIDGLFGGTSTVEVVGVLSEQVLQAVLVNPALLTGTFHFTTQQLFLLTGAPGVDPRTVIQTFQTHFFADNLEVFDFAQILSTTLQFTNAFIDLLEVFVALGLIVGITSLGILALRAVVERRTQIGVIRAVGFRRSQVLAVFLTEYSFLALMGIGIGAVMGLVLAYNLNEAVGGFFAFSIPWTNLAFVLGTSYALTLVATGMPSFRASRIPPAEAIRYSE